MHSQITTQFGVKTRDQFPSLAHRHDSHGFRISLSQRRVLDFRDFGDEVGWDDGEVLTCGCRGIWGGGGCDKRVNGRCSNEDGRERDIGVQQTLEWQLHLEAFRLSYCILMVTSEKQSDSWEKQKAVLRPHPPP